MPTFLDWLLYLLTWLCNYPEKTCPWQGDVVLKVLQNKVVINSLLILWSFCIWFNTFQYSRTERKPLIYTSSPVIYRPSLIVPEISIWGSCIQTL